MATGLSAGAERCRRLCCDGRPPAEVTRWPAIPRRARASGATKPAIRLVMSCPRPRRSCRRGWHCRSFVRPAPPAAGARFTAMPRRRSSATGRPRRRSCSSARSCGEQEDRAGKPFVGPAGNLLDRAGRGADRPRGSLPHQRGEALQVRAARQASDSPQAIGAGDPGVPAVAQERDRRRQAEAAGVSGGDGGAGAARQGVSRDPIARAGAARHAMGTGGCSARLRQADQMARRLYSRVG